MNKETADKIVEEFKTLCIWADFFYYNAEDFEEAKKVKAKALIIYIDNPELKARLATAALDFKWNLLDELDFLNYEFYAIMKGLAAEE